MHYIPLLTSSTCEKLFGVRFFLCVPHEVILGVGHLHRGFYAGVTGVPEGSACNLQIIQPILRVQKEGFWKGGTFPERCFRHFPRFVNMYY